MYAIMARTNTQLYLLLATINGIGKAQKSNQNVVFENTT